MNKRKIKEKYEREIKIKETGREGREWKREKRKGTEG